MIWEQPPQGISVAPTDRLKRALEEGDTRRRESLARLEAWSRARAQWSLRKQARLEIGWKLSPVAQPLPSSSTWLTDGWLTAGGSRRDSRTSNPHG